MNITVNPEYIRMKPFVESLPASFDHSGELVYDKRNKVRVFDVDGEKVVVKRYKVPLFYQRIDYSYFRPSKAKRAYLFALTLETLDIQTPSPIAYIEDTNEGVFRQGYFVSAYTSHPSLKDHRDELLENPVLFDAYVGFLIEMHNKGFMHGDQNLSNILFWKESDSYFFEVIDINRSHFISNPSREDCLKNLMRISRDRELSHKVVERYAEMRGWEKSDCVYFVDKQIDKYERKRKMRKFYHKIFPKK